jgi:DNA helicase-2/ATP-dependent DNA helicase PcrA
MHNKKEETILNSNLTEEQKKVITLSEGRHAVFAPPGTGKTEILANRIIYALESGINQEEMLCLTFTNRAARNMKERIQTYFPAPELYIGNIHGFCYRFIKENKLMPRYYSLLDEEDSTLLMKEAAYNLSVELEKGESFDDAFIVNNHLKQKMLNIPNDLIQPVDKFNQSTFDKYKKLSKEYESLKNESDFIDFDDLLNIVYLALISSETAKKYKWIQVDEVQDLNPLQLKIIDLLSDDGAHIVYLGDLEQSIYSFMGADFSNVSRLLKKCTRHTLSINFRSPEYLLKVFNDYAKTNLSPVWQNEPIANNKNDYSFGRLNIYFVSGQPSAEEDFIINYLKNRIESEKRENYSILVNSNKRADAFSNKLKSCNINHFKVSGYDLFRRKVIKDVMAFLNVLENKTDRLSWIRIFSIFSNTSLKDTRKFVYELWNSGLYPWDLLEYDLKTTNPLKEFKDILSNQRVVVFDTETTGKNTAEDDIIQIAAVEIIKGKIGRNFNVYIKTDRSLEDEFVNGDILIAHNLEFDNNILRNYCRRHNYDFAFNNINFDTLELTRRVYPKLHSYKLADLIEQFMLKGSNSHNAIDDVNAAANLVFYLDDQSRYKLKLIDDFTKANLEKIENIKEKLEPLWNEYKNRRKCKANLADIVLDFYAYAKSAINYNIKDEEKEHIEKLVNHIKRSCREGVLSEIIKEYIPLYRLYKEPDLIMGDEKVVVSTIHKAKGLEFDNVIITGCVDGIYPFFKSKTNEERDEDARLLYVGLTRAKKSLTITTYDKFMSYNKKPSPFLNAIYDYFKIHKVTLNQSKKFAAKEINYDNERQINEAFNKLRIALMGTK